MCRNIKTLYNFEPPVTEEEIHAASLQFVRKITGFNKPSHANEAAFDSAVHDISHVAARLLASLESTAPPKNRDDVAARAKARAVPAVRSDQLVHHRLNEQAALGLRGRAVHRGHRWPRARAAARARARSA